MGKQDNVKSKDPKHNSTKPQPQKDRSKDRGELSESQLDKVSGGRMPLRPKDL